MTPAQLLALARRCAAVKPVGSPLKPHAANQLLKLTLPQGTNNERRNQT